MPTNSETIADRVLMALARMGKPQTWLAKKIGIHASSLSNALKRNNATWDRWEDIAKTLNIPVDWVLAGNTPAPWSSMPNVALDERGNAITPSFLPLLEDGEGIRFDGDERARRGTPSFDDLKKYLGPLQKRYPTLQISITEGPGVPSVVGLKSEKTPDPRVDPELHRLGESIATYLTEGACLGFMGQVTAGGGFVTESQDPDDWKPVPLRSGWKLVKIEGDSGLPIVWPGQSVIVDTDGTRTPPKHNRIVVVQTKDGRAFCKRWCDAGDGHIVLASLNTGADSVAIHTDDVASVAVVVGTLYTDSVAR
jgi:hypothetical protein